MFSTDFLMYSLEYDILIKKFSEITNMAFKFSKLPYLLCPFPDS